MKPREIVICQRGLRGRRFLGIVSISVGSITEDVDALERFKRGLGQPRKLLRPGHENVPFPALTQPLQSSRRDKRRHHHQTINPTPKRPSRHIGQSERPKGDLIKPLWKLKSHPQQLVLKCLDGFLCPVRQRPACYERWQCRHERREGAIGRKRIPPLYDFALETQYGVPGSIEREVSTHTQHPVSGGTVRGDKSQDPHLRVKRAAL